MSILLVYWIIQSIVAFWLFQKAWRYDFDVEIEELLAFLAFSLFPISWLAALVVWLGERPSKYRKPIVVFKKY